MDIVPAEGGTDVFLVSDLAAIQLPQSRTRGLLMSQHPDCPTSMGFNIQTGTEYITDFTADPYLTIHYVNDRVLNFEYHYQAQSNMATYASDWPQKAGDAFNEANTTLHQDAALYSHSDEIVEVIVDAPNPLEYATFERYADNHASSDWRNNVNSKQLRYCLVYSIGNINAHLLNGPPNTHYVNTVGFSIKYSHTPYDYPFCVYVLVGKIISILPSSQVANEIRRVIVHELGHQRGLVGHEGNVPHGHNGQLTDKCVMHDPSETNYVSSIPPKFCDGHKQKLMNSRWLMEDLP